MVVDINFVEKLKAFGLNSYQAKLWIALLSRGIATAGELSDLSNVPRSRAYDVLESLEKKGFIIMKIGKPIKYIAVAPNEVVKRVQKQIKERSENDSKLVQEFENGVAMNDLTILYSTGVEKVDPTDLVSSIKGRTNIYLELAQMIDDAKKSVIISTTDEGLMRKTEHLKKIFAKLKKKGVSIRIAAPINDKSKNAIKELKGIAQIKNATSDSRFVIVDSKNVAFMLMNDKDVNASYDSGIKVKSEFFAKSLVDLFDKTWKELKTV